MEKVYENIKAIRKAKNISQADMADKLGMYPANYNRLESGKTEITLARLQQIADIFGMTVIEILNYGGGVESVKENDSAKVRELEKEIIELKERIDLLTQLNEQAKEINKIRKIEYLTMISAIVAIHPETAETFKKIGEDETVQNGLEAIKNAYMKMVDIIPKN